MKNTRKLLAAVMALAMVSAIAPMSAFAINQDDVAAGSNTGTMTATYDATAKYTVTIPSGVTLDSTNAVSTNIEASDVMLENGKKITVKLTGASNTESGASFSAKTTKGDSTATYTIGKGEATTGISVGDTVAEFTGNGTQALTFSKAEGATYAGTHTETLTFGIAVEDAAVAVTGLTLNKTTLKLTSVGDTATLNATVSPDDATDKTVTWESSDTAIATVDETGKVTAVGVGEATITAKAGDVTATCSVNSLDCSKASYTISASSSKPISFDNGNVTYTSSGSYIISKNATNKFTANGGRKIYKIVLSGKSIESQSSGTGWSNGTWSSSEGAAEVTFNASLNYNNNNVGIGLTMTVYYK